MRPAQDAESSHPFHPSIWDIGLTTPFHLNIRDFYFLVSMPKSTEENNTPEKQGFSTMGCCAIVRTGLNPSSASGVTSGRSAVASLRVVDGMVRLFFNTKYCERLSRRADRSDVMTRARGGLGDGSLVLCYLGLEAPPVSPGLYARHHEGLVSLRAGYGAGRAARRTPILISKEAKARRKPSWFPTGLCCFRV